MTTYTNSNSTIYDSLVGACPLTNIYQISELYPSVEGTIHGFDHAVAVAKLATTISMLEGGNTTDIIIASLLHDVGRKNEHNDQKHGERGSVIARKFLSERPIDCNIDNVCKLIAEHNLDTDFGSQDVRIMRDADRLDLLRIGVYELNISRLTTKTGIMLVPKVVDLYGRINGYKQSDIALVKGKAIRVAERRNKR